MRVFLDKITVENHVLAMDIIKGLENGPSADKYECILRPACNKNPLNEIAIYTVEEFDKPAIGFADENK
jgi:hypothetical protein